MATDIADFTPHHPLLTEDPSTDPYTFSHYENITDSGYTLKNFQYINISVRLLIGLLALNCNLLTVVAIGRYEYLQTCTNYLIAALAFADMVGGFTCILVFINYLTPMTDETWLNMCAAEHTLSQMSAGLNLNYILLIAVDRFIYITFPLRYYSLVKPRLIHGATFVMFIVILIFALLANLAIEDYLHPSGFICRGIFPKSVVLSLSMWVYVTTSITVLLYASIAWTAFRQSRAIQQAQNVPVGQGHKITKMLSLMLEVYMACYLPQVTIHALKQHIAPHSYVIMERVSSWIWWINACVNPFIYAWKNKNFNKAFRSLLGLKTATIGPLQAN